MPPPANQSTALAPAITQRVTALRLDGSSGKNRADPRWSLIPADNDLQAVEQFLAEFADSPHTQRLYRKECERLLLWAVAACGKPLSSLDRGDFQCYIDFLADPQPAEIWCGPRRPRSAPDWKPFVGPLQPSAKATAIAVMNALMSYLVDAAYLAANPLKLIRQRRKRARQSSTVPEKIERYLDPLMLQAFIATVEDLPQESLPQRNAYERARFITLLLLLMAPRAGDLEQHCMNSFRERRDRWWWSVVGKGGKGETLPVPDEMLQALIRYRCHLGLPSLPSADDRTPLLLSLNGRKGITARRLNQILKTLFRQAAERLQPNAPHKAATLRKASAHWGRHTSITAWLDQGIEPRLVQKSARHSDARTTQLYTHSEEDAWHDAMRRVRVGWEEHLPADRVETP